jgi:hypothetical protein
MQLFDANDLRDQSLEGRLMTPKEADHFRRKALNEITLTNHIIELNFESEPAPYVPPVKVAKFKPPSVLARPAPNAERNIADHDVFAQYQNNSAGYSSRNTGSAANPFSAPRDYRGQQRGDDFDDVDEIWGNNSGKNGSRDAKRNEDVRQVRPPVNPGIQSRSRVNVDSYSHHDDTRRVDSRSVGFERPREEPEDTDYDADDCEPQSISTSSRRELEDEQPYQANRKRPVSEVSRPSFDDDHEEQQRQRPKQDNYPPRIDDSKARTTVQQRHEDSNLQIRGSMKRVDESIWDD